MAQGKPILTGLGAKRARAPVRVFQAGPASSKLRGDEVMAEPEPGSRAPSPALRADDAEKKRPSVNGQGATGAGHKKAKHVSAKQGENDSSSPKSSSDETTAREERTNIWNRQQQRKITGGTRSPIPST